MNYKYTLNLPKTTFSMQANLKENEINILKYWTKIKKKEINYKKKIFILNDGPPYANGNIHMGHAFNKILKDIVCKFKKLNGFEIDFTFGWDCHGLPIELNVEKKIIRIKNIISDNEFKKICKSYAISQIKTQKKSFFRLGIETKWNIYYKTMDYKFESLIIENFKKMLEQKHIYLGQKPIYWCFDCKSALAESEVEYYIKKSNSIYVIFKFLKNPFDYNKFLNLIIWTTTAWTLPFNKAVALNKDLIYLVFNYKNNQYVISKDLLNLIKNKFKIKQIKIKLIFKAIYINKYTLIHPIYKKEVKIILSEHVKNDYGTGCVHIAPAYGYEDYKVGHKNKIKQKNSVNEKGTIKKKNKFIKNLSILQTNKNVILILKKLKKLIFKELIIHKYPYCWRHKTTLIFRTTKQWFFKINNKKLKNKIINLSNKFIKWIPNVGKIKIKTMLKNRLDWCISRQRIWGVPIVTFVNKKNKIHPNSINFLKKIVNLTKKYGSDFWYNLDTFKLFSINKKIYKKTIDVLDVWFDSSNVYNYISKKKACNIPLNLCLEGNDQYRGWFQVSLINSMSIQNKIPYKEIMTHGFILDHIGRKMSKSLNNVILPNKIIKKHGADIFRLWVSSVNYQFDINFSEETLNRICEAYRKIRNTFKFILSNLKNLNLKNNIKILKFDIWIIYKIFLLKKKVEKKNKIYKYYSIYKDLYNFCINDLCSKYFEIIKDKIYTLNCISRLSSQICMYTTLYTLIKLISPILSFTMEEIWNYLKYKDNYSIFFSNFKINVKLLKKIKLNIIDIINWDKLFDIKILINKNISEKKTIIETSNNLDLSVKIISNIYWYKKLINIKKELKYFFIVSKINIKKSNIKDIKIDITKTNLIKCERCWNRHIKKLNLKICKKCIKNLFYKKQLGAK